MIRYAGKRLADLGALAMIMAAASASAQTNEWKYDKLNDVMQRRSQQPGAVPVPPPAETQSGGSRGIQQIQPAEREQKYHQLRRDAEPSRPVIRGDVTGRADASRSGNLQSDRASGGGAATARPTVDAVPNVGSPPRTRGLRLAKPPAPPSAPAAGEVQVAGEVKEVPVAKPNSYVIQLRPETTGRQLDALLAKYKLRIVSDELIKIGSIVVEQQSSAPAETNRARSYSKIEEILEPRIIRDLRKEPAVKEAFVNTVVAPKWLPRPVATQLPMGAKTYKWRWGKADAADGNWGLKYLRMPTVWAILKSYRAKHPDKVAPTVGVIDSGFGRNADLTFTPVLDTPLAEALPGASACAVGHGTHVAGIVGAKFDNDGGIDGVAPNVGIEVVGVKADFVLERPQVQPGTAVEAEENSVDTVLMLYTDVLKTATRYVVPNLNDSSRLRVINLSLAYNWYNILGKKNPADNKILQRHIASEAALFKTLAELAQDKILFVVAAGNDSRGWETPLEAKWASSIAWAGTHETPQSKPSPNILVAEAFDRDGNRADFSNRGGHVSAPGVDIMSTAIAGSGQDVALCSGTSQAAPHVAAIAALMFEMAPDKKPKEIAEILKKTAQPSGQKFAAPLVDPLDAVLAASPETLGLLADLNNDGKVGRQDLVAFKESLASLQLIALRAAGSPAGSLIASAGPAPGDLNNDGLPDAGQVWWPRADLNGSGLATATAGDERSLCNGVMTDLDIIKLAWQDQTETFDRVMAELELTNPAPIAASAPPGAAPRPAALRSAPTRSLAQGPRSPCAPQ